MASTRGAVTVETVETLGKRLFKAPKRVEKEWPKCHRHIYLKEKIQAKFVAGYKARSDSVLKYFSCVLIRDGVP